MSAPETTTGVVTTEAFAAIADLIEENRDTFVGVAADKNAVVGLIVLMLRLGAGVPTERADA